MKRIGSKVVIVYFLMTVIACIVGIVMVNITHPGVGFTLDNMQAFDTSKVKTPSFVNFCLIWYQLILLTVWLKIRLCK